MNTREEPKMNRLKVIFPILIINPELNEVTISSLSNLDAVTATTPETPVAMSTSASAAPQLPATI